MTARAIAGLVGVVLYGVVASPSPIVRSARWMDVSANYIEARRAGRTANPERTTRRTISVTGFSASGTRRSTG